MFCWWPPCEHAPDERPTQVSTALMRVGMIQKQHIPGPQDSKRLVAGDIYDPDTSTRSISGDNTPLNS